MDTNLNPMRTYAVAGNKVYYMICKFIWYIFLQNFNYLTLIPIYELLRNIKF